MHHITKERSITQETEDMLNERLRAEGVSSATYLGMASWCDQKDYRGAANFLYKHAEEERDHMHRFLRYINEAGGKAIVSTIPAAKATYKSLREIFEVLLETEIVVSTKINEVAAHCLSIKDYPTYDFLTWFFREQREEEQWTRRVLAIFNTIGDDTRLGLWTIDQQIERLQHGGEEQHD